MQNKCLERKIKKTTGVNEYDFVFPTFPFSEFQKDFNARQVNQLILPVQRPHMCVLSVSDEWQLEIVLFEKTVSFMTECVFRLVNHAWRKLYKLHLQVCTLKSLKRRNLKKILQEITGQQLDFYHTVVDLIPIQDRNIISLYWCHIVLSILVRRIWWYIKTVRTCWLFYLFSSRVCLKMCFWCWLLSEIKSCPLQKALSDERKKHFKRTEDEW